MADWLVTCVRKPDRESRVEHITHIGIRSMHSSDMSSTVVTADEAIKRLETGTDEIWAGSPSGPMAQVIVHPRNGRKHLTTVRDGTETDNLLMMPECSNFDCSIASMSKPFNWLK